MRENERELRSQLRTWLTSQLPDEWRLDALRELSPEDAAKVRTAWGQRLHSGGWSLPTGPRWAGGLELSPRLSWAFHQEISAAGAPSSTNAVVIDIVSPLLWLWGEDSPITPRLPGMLAHSDVWCLGLTGDGTPFSEAQGAQRLRAVGVRSAHRAFVPVCDVNGIGSGFAVVDLEAEGVTQLTSRGVLYVDGVTVHERDVLPAPDGTDVTEVAAALHRGTVLAPQMLSLRDAVDDEFRHTLRDATRDLERGTALDAALAGRVGEAFTRRALWSQPSEADHRAVAIETQLAYRDALEEIAYSPVEAVRHATRQTAGPGFAPVDRRTHLAALERVREVGRPSTTGSDRLGALSATLSGWDTEDSVRRDERGVRVWAVEPWRALGEGGWFELLSQYLGIVDRRDVPDIDEPTVRSLEHQLDLIGAFGASSIVGPFADTIGLVVPLLTFCAEVRLAEDLLDRIVEGELVVSTGGWSELCASIGSGTDADPPPRLEKAGTSLVLDGTLDQVAWAHLADVLLVSAHSEDGSALVAVDPRTDGLEITRHTAEAAVSRVVLSEVSVDPGSIIQVERLDDAIARTEGWRLLTENALAAGAARALARHLDAPSRERPRGHRDLPSVALEVDLEAAKISTVTALAAEALLRRDQSWRADVLAARLATLRMGRRISGLATTGPATDAESGPKGRITESARPSEAQLRRAFAVAVGQDQP